jgi:hypothetical protein
MADAGISLAAIERIANSREIGGTTDQGTTGCDSRASVLDVIHEVFIDNPLQTLGLGFLAKILERD